MATAPDQKAPSAQPPEPRPRKLGSLRMIWRYASRYPFQVIVAAVALGIAALATLAIPWQFKAMIDSGFVAGGGDVAPHFRLFYVIVQIGRAHVCTPVTNSHLVCRLLLEKKKKTY